LDYTGSASTNLIKGEVQPLAGTGTYLVGTDWGPFYKDSLIAQVGSTPLILGTHYQIAAIDSYLTRRTGQEVITGIVITDTSLGDSVVLQYQAVGGPVNVNQKLLRQTVTDEKIGHHSANWNTDVVNKPVAYQPQHHLHDGKLDVYGMEYIVDVMKSLADAIPIGISPTLTFLKDRINNDMAAHVASEDHSGLYYERSNQYTRSEMDSLYMGIGSASNATSVDGPTQIYQGGTAQFQITNFDNRSVYSVAMDNVTVGWFSWGQDKYGNDGFSLTIPSNFPAGKYTYRLTCDAAYRDLPIEVLSGGIATPTVYASLLDTEPTVTITSSTFATTAGSDTGKTAELVVTNTNTGVVVYDQTLTLVNGAIPTTTLSNLSLGTTYAVKVRFSGANYGWSAWSDPRSFTTKSTYVVVVTTKIAKPVLTLTPDLYKPTAHCSGSDFSIVSGTVTSFYQYVVKYYATGYESTPSLVYGVANWSSYYGNKGPTFDLDVSEGTTYHVFIQYVDSAGNASEWSDEKVFTTLNDYTPVPYQVNFEIDPTSFYFKYINQTHYLQLVAYYFNISGFTADQFEVIGFDGDTTFRSMTYGIKYDCEPWQDSDIGFSIIDPNSSAWDNFTASSNPNNYVYQSGIYDDTLADVITTASLVAGAVTVNGVTYNAFRSFTKNVYADYYTRDETDGGSGSGIFFESSNATEYGSGIDTTNSAILLQFSYGNRLVSIGNCRLFEPSQGSFTAKLKIRLKSQYWPTGNYSYY
jgi:hypothetical protein